MNAFHVLSRASITGIRVAFLLPYRVTSTSANSKSPFSRLDIEFSNGEEACKSKTNSELVRALLVYKMTSYETFVGSSMAIMTFGQKVLGKYLFEKLMRATFYGQFVAGSDVTEITPFLKKNLRYGVKAILNYSVEEDIREEKPAKATGSHTIADNSTRVNRHFKAFGDKQEKVTVAPQHLSEGEEQCDRNMDTVMEVIDVVAKTTEKTGFAAVKLTALGKPQLLMQISHILTHMRGLFDKFTADQTDVALKRLSQEMLNSELENLGVPFSRDDTKHWFSWKGTCGVDFYEWSHLLDSKQSLRKLCNAPNKKTGKMEPLFPSLSTEDMNQLQNMLRRMDRILEYAGECDIRVMVDAEQTYFQPAINRLTMEMMRKYNKKKPIIFNTYQCYLKETLNNIRVDMDLARREDFCFGAKAVRGAYMDQERERAEAVGYEDPINPDYESTSAMYESVIMEVMKEAKLRDLGKVSVMAATHNESAVRFVIKNMERLEIHPSDRIICFGQNSGMCDHVSFLLGQAGFSVYKYVPFGPLKHVLPYLSRRAQDNRGIFKKVQKERKLMRNELIRRVKGGQLFYKPEIPPSA